jgi:phosphoribosyl 1,2-cyclic phosphodiesterase
MIKQLRSSGGLWLSYEGTNVLIDPGPGSIVRCAASRPKLDPTTLDAVILTHRHLDHANDINVMIEAMTEGGFKKRGVVFCPEDAISKDSIILPHSQKSLQNIEFLKEGKTYTIGKISFSTPTRHIHSVETYGLRFRMKGVDLSLISDTKYFEELKDVYKSEILIINVVFSQPRPDIEHLSLEDAENLINSIRPKLAILTHFGMSMLKAKPHNISQELTKKLNIEVTAAYDGMKIDL